MDSEVSKLVAKWRAEADTFSNTCGPEDRGYNNAQYQLADELEAALARPSAAGDAAWRCVERLLTDAYSTGMNGGAFDMLAARQDLTAALTGAQP